MSLFSMTSLTTIVIVGLIVSSVHPALIVHHALKKPQYGLDSIETKIPRFLGLVKNKMKQAKLFEERNVFEAIMKLRLRRLRSLRERSELEAAFLPRPVPVRLYKRSPQVGN